jgi:hypothetical protein
LESVNDSGVSFSSALCSRAATFARVYALSHPAPTYPTSYPTTGKKKKKNVADDDDDQDDEKEEDSSTQEEEVSFCS